MPKDIKKEFTSSLKILIGLLASLIIVVFFPNLFDRLLLNEHKIITDFTKGQSYKCQTKFSPTYLVSKKRGWEVKDNSFTKNDIVFDFLECDENE